MLVLLFLFLFLFKDIAMRPQVMTLHRVTANVFGRIRGQEQFILLLLVEKVGRDIPICDMHALVRAVSRLCSAN